MVALKPERHHWWPRSVTKFWSDNSGCITRIDSAGASITQQPKKFGYIRNIHHVKAGDEPSVWDFSYERTFDEADSNFPHLVSWLQQFPVGLTSDQDTFPERLQPLIISTSDRERISICLASLIVRSPSMRNRIEITVRDLRSDYYGLDQVVPSSLISVSAANGQINLSSLLLNRGKFAVFQSADQEFLYGDGFYHNLTDLTSIHRSATCAIPITPNIFVFYRTNTSGYSNPIAFNLSINAEEVKIVNTLTQIYSKDYIFYKSQPPDILPEFTKGQFLEIEYHKVFWLDQIFDAMTNVRYR